MKDAHKVILPIFYVILVGCGGSAPENPVDSTVESRVYPSEVESITADALLYDDKSKLAYKSGEDIPFSGKVVWYFTDGKLQQETEYENGREHGSTIWWYEDGARAGQTFHQAGVLDGPLVQWYPGGKAKELQGVYSSGLRDGQFVKWHKEGGRRSMTPYDKGKRVGRAIGWHTGGSKAWEANWVNDIAHGLCREWYNGGESLKNEKTYVNGKLQGKETWWYEHGQKSHEAIWVQGSRHGLTSNWYEDGSKMDETSYAKGKRHGIKISWYEGGKQKAYEVLFHEGLQVGFQEWDESGIPIQ
ncbi:MAG: hypothetical protein P8M70_08250 [Verrucomicrobiota bacterium]|nr:hypothetical protein [Verrucomicrobiota bacterium]